ncbi:hypothetical protein Hanom_Chr02g00157771 [Helianthus anomalus]
MGFFLTFIDQHALYNGEHQSEDKKEKGAKTLYALGNRSNKHLVAWVRWPITDLHLF